MSNYPIATMYPAPPPVSATRSKATPTAHRPPLATKIAGMATRVHRAALVCGMLILALAVAACGAGPQNFVQQAMPILLRFDAREQVANNTARVSLSPVLMDMQDLVAEVDALPTADTEMKTLVVRAMNMTIDYYMAFQAQADDARMASLKAETEDAWAAIQDLAAMRARDSE